MSQIYSLRVLSAFRLTVGEPVPLKMANTCVMRTLFAVRLIALRLGRTDWSDLGHPERVMAVLHAAGLEPWWMKEWQVRRRPPAVVASSPAY